MMKNLRKKAEELAVRGYIRGVKTMETLAGNRGEGYIDTAVVILISVVLGALLLAGLYALFGDVILPELTRRIQEMFNYAG